MLSWFAYEFLNYGQKMCCVWSKVTVTTHSSCQSWKNSLKAWDTVSTRMGSTDRRLDRQTYEWVDAQTTWKHNVSSHGCRWLWGIKMLMTFTGTHAEFGEFVWIYFDSTYPIVNNGLWACACGAHLLSQWMEFLRQTASAVQRQLSRDVFRSELN